MNQISERRRWPRHRVRIPVSLKYSDTRTFSQTWHVGETYDISVEGMRIITSSLPELPEFSRLEILCFPKEDSLLPYIPEPEPVSMTGVVIWQDIKNKSIGVKLDG
ncbi:MAG: PilZ domain-containing protein [Proteobacteria bacterium]|nr:PilZ domain-containing protein [Pseudomonadota bacterium]MBU1585291.1 PilZ domain-containing protein [Pseudomonadota bacterium]MBU2452445.1 PilZ domain-containing protein [Pseudomonadota bacterium]MBU2630523.1 PilZ domain-containing protein [Pseudomonadota bacterium]